MYLYGEETESHPLPKAMKISTQNETNQYHADMIHWEMWVANFVVLLSEVHKLNKKITERIIDEIWIDSVKVV